MRKNVILVFMLPIAIAACNVGGGGRNAADLQTQYTRVQQTSGSGGTAVDFMCIASGNTESVTCASKPYVLQAQFNNAVSRIESIIIESKYATSVKALSQPESVIQNFANLSPHEKARKLADYGYKVQNESLLPFLATASNLFNTKVASLRYVESYFVAPNAKTVDRVMEKESNILKNMDFARGSVVIDYYDISIFIKTMQELASEKTPYGPQKLKIVAIKDRLLKPADSYYRDVQVFLQDDKGFIYELLILSHNMFKKKNGLSHVMYEAQRALENKLIEPNTLSYSDKQTISSAITEVKGYLRDLHTWIFQYDSVTSCPQYSIEIIDIKQTREICQGNLNELISGKYIKASNYESEVRDKFWAWKTKNDRYLGDL